MVVKCSFKTKFKIRDCLNILFQAVQQTQLDLGLDFTGPL